MKSVTPPILLRLAVLAVMGLFVTGLSWPLSSAAQDKTSDGTTHKHSGQSTDAGNDLPAQLMELRAKAAALEAALEKRYPGTVRKDATPGKGMGMTGSSGMGMGMMRGGDDAEMAEMMRMMRTVIEMKMMQMKNKGMMRGMSGMQGDMATAGEGMQMMGGGMMRGRGMQMMGSMMNETSGMQTPSALPGFPGASHIYHIGATGFFLDHPQHVQFTSEQQTALNGIKEKALLKQATMQRQIESAEQELWTLTASDEPDAKKIDAKVREIDKLRGDQRIAFIRAVGEAANVLTAEQRQVLVGSSSPDTGTSTNPRN